MQGCTIRCEGCANQHIWDFDGGQWTYPEELLDRIPADVEGISITGGEPLDQPYSLIAFLRKAYPKYEVFLTSGYTIEQIRVKYPDVLMHVDILVDGPFDKTKVDMTTAWRGSTNQGIHLLTDRAQKYRDYKPEYNAEIILDTNGDAIITGFSVPDFLKDGSL
jgi:anaerobic ribonucleoside-triphosphate reductase activating protein